MDNLPNLTDPTSVRNIFPTLIFLKKYNKMYTYELQFFNEYNVQPLISNNINIYNTYINQLRIVFS